MTERPPHSITPDMVSRVAQIGEAIGRAEAAGVARDLRLRRINRIATIQGSLAIAGPKTTAQLMAEPGLSHRPTFRNNYIHPEIFAGLVGMTHPELRSGKNQKYRPAGEGHVVR